MVCDTDYLGATSNWFILVVIQLQLLKIFLVCLIINMIYLFMNIILQKNSRNGWLFLIHQQTITMQEKGSTKTQDSGYSRMTDMLPGRKIPSLSYGSMAFVGDISIYVTFFNVNI